MRFAQECQAAKKLDHPHAVQVIDFGLDGMKPYLLPEIVGQELRVALPADSDISLDALV